MLCPFDTTEEAREVARLSAPRSRFCAAADEPAELRSLMRLWATEAASSSSSVSGEARCLPLRLPLRDLEAGLAFGTAGAPPALAALERVTRDDSGGGDFRLRFNGRASSCCSASTVSDNGACGSTASSATSGSATSLSAVSLRNS